MMTESVYQFTFGEFTGYVIVDGIFYMSPSSVFFDGADPALLQQALQSHGLTTEGIALPVHCLLLERGQERILIDSGAGDDWIRRKLGRLKANMATAGITPESITHVILTHGHFDHAGGIVDNTGHPTFPNARFFMARGGWHYWTEGAFEENPNVENEHYYVKTRDALRSLDFQLFDAPENLLAGVRVIPTPGHTANHISIEIESQGNYLLATSDALVHEIHVTHPTWIPNWSVNRDDTVTSTKKLLAYAVDNNALVYSCHCQFPGFGRVIKGNDEWQRTPVQP